MDLALVALFGPVMEIKPCSGTETEDEAPSWPCVWPCARERAIVVQVVQTRWSE